MHKLIQLLRSRSNDCCTQAKAIVAGKVKGIPKLAWGGVGCYGFEGKPYEYFCHYDTGR